MVGIIGAMQQEIERLLNDLENKEEINFGIRTFYYGNLYGKEAVIVKAGIGKVNAGVTTSLLIENFDVDFIINIGVAGGVNGANHQDVVISESVVYHDADVTAFGDYVHGQIPGETPTFEADQTLLNNTIFILEKLDLPHHKGMIASGDQFVTSTKAVSKILQTYDTIYAIEMEAAAIAHIASIYKIPFIIYRSISDIVGDASQETDFYEFLDGAISKVTNVLKELFKTI